MEKVKLVQTAKEPAGRKTPAYNVLTKNGLFVMLPEILLLMQFVTLVASLVTVLTVINA